MKPVRSKNSLTGLFYLVHALLVLIFLCEYLVVLPYEEHVRPSLLIPFYYVLGIYLAASIVYHYHMACVIDPGIPEIVNGEPRCTICENYKPEGTHHCSICQRCVVRMDHHCVWINQCVGRDNHRFFLQFVIYVWISQVSIVIVNYKAFWEHFQSLDHAYTVLYCAENIILAPWHDWLCSKMPYFLNACVCFVYGLALLLSVVLGLFAAYNIYFISLGETFIDHLQYPAERRKVIGWHASDGITCMDNWRRFLGLSEGRSFFRHILLPSSHLSSSELMKPSKIDIAFTV